MQASMLLLAYILQQLATRSPLLRYSVELADLAATHIWGVPGSQAS